MLVEPLTVLLYAPPDAPPPRQHEVATHTAVAQKIAAVMGGRFGGVCHGPNGYRGRCFFVPYDTLLAPVATRLGVRTADDLFGAVVPYRFVRTKTITHQLIGPEATRPVGWSDTFPSRVASVVVPGFSAFGRADAHVAAERLLAMGRVRLKPALAAGSRGHTIASTADEIEGALEQIAADDLASCGVVLETELMDSQTFSIGQIRLAGSRVSYHGTQRETYDNHGGCVYGGSDLVVARGGFEDLARVTREPVLQRAIAHAALYDRAAVSYPGLIASRRNYDVLLGTDGDGRRRMGVLEASWRIGGASPAEIAAFAALKFDPSLRTVRVSTVEAYGDRGDVPLDAVVHFAGVDDVAGPVIRYTRIEERRAEAA